MKRTNPLKSLPGWILTAALLVGVGLVGLSAFSPGALGAQAKAGVETGGFRSHAEFERQCWRCHAPLQDGQDALCLDCHNPVAVQKQLGQGTHSLVDAALHCAACHQDHQGRTANLLQPGLERFDHNLTGFSLVWHAYDYQAQPMECQACHAVEAAFELDPGSCSDCHAAWDAVFMLQHSLDYGPDCLACHDGRDRMADFDHSKTDFPLEGKHRATACIDCHRERIFEGLPLECQACHSEPDSHKGLFASACSDCHDPQGWSPAAWNGQPFEHATTAGFSLARHPQQADGQPLTCQDCHRGSMEADTLPACRECHALQNGQPFIDPHQTLFGEQCLACHDGVDRFSDFNHARVFLLDGAHATLACQDCHAERKFAGIGQQCADCHAEPEIHAGFFGLNCQDCHLTSAWSPAELHNHRFPLDHGEQGMVACQTCHPANYVSYTCYGCHEHDPGEIAEEHQEENISLAELADCAECHPDGRKDDD